MFGSPTMALIDNEFIFYSNLPPRNTLKENGTTSSTISAGVSLPNTSGAAADASREKPGGISNPTADAVIAAITCIGKRTGPITAFQNPAGGSNFKPVKYPQQSPMTCAFAKAVSRSSAVATCNEVAACRSATAYRRRNWNSGMANCSVTSAQRPAENARAPECWRQFGGARHGNLKAAGRYGQIRALLMGQQNRCRQAVRTTTVLVRSSTFSATVIAMRMQHSLPSPSPVSPG